MYLSQLFLNRSNRQVLRQAGQPYEMHRTLATCCFEQTAIDAQKNVARAKTLETNSAYGLLFRLDFDRNSDDLVLLAQSQVKPDWGNLPAGYALQVQGPKQFDLKNQLVVGQVLGFRLRASPTKRIGNSTLFKQDIGKRVAIKKEQEQLEWLERKGMQHGFELRKKMHDEEEEKVIDTVVSKEGHQLGFKHEGNTEHDMRWYSVLFNGTLIVKNPDLLWLAIQCGIGSAKGMGFGLLSLSRIPSPVLTGEGADGIGHR